MITSRQNEFVKRVASLKEKKYRRLYGEYVAEGAKQVREAVAAGKEISCIVVSSAYAGERPEGCVEVSAEVFSKLSGEAAPQGAAQKAARQNGGGVYDGAQHMRHAPLSF